MSFSHFQLDPRLEAGIAASGYVQPTPIQEAAIPEVLARRDVVGVAQTGTGKTAAFMLPILHNLLDGPRGRVRTLVLAPTRELAEQTAKSTRVFAKQTKLRTVTVYGGVSKRRQTDKLRKGAEIVVACPGRLLDVWEDGDLDLDHIETLVLDEADRMFDMGFLPDVRRILNLLPAARQNLLFSATMAPPVRALADSMLVDPASITIGAEAPAATVEQVLYPTNEALKTSLLVALLKHQGPQRTLVFCRTKIRAQRLATVLGQEGHRVAAIEGDMSQHKRQAAMDGFRNGRYTVLVATDVAARGIDVTAIETVVNYDMPETFEAYTHRVGRTGRANLTGEALNLVCVMDTPLVREIQENEGKPLEQRTVPGFDYGDYTPQLRILERRRGRGQPGALGSRRGGGGARRSARFR